MEIQMKNIKNENVNIKEEKTWVQKYCVRKIILC
jgi:hypothetical protein